MISDTDLLQQLAQADACRQSRRWQQALALYRGAEPVLSGHSAAAVRHNLALCCLALGDAKEAVAYCESALALAPGLWQSELVLAKALRATDQPERALAVLEDLLQRLPERSEARLEAAALMLNEFGDARRAQELAKPGPGASAQSPDGLLTSLMARLYDRDQPAAELSRELSDFARKHLALPPAHAAGRAPGMQNALQDNDKGRIGSAVGTGKAGRRTRVGLISPQFCCSPVYFFCIGALRLLADECELLFFSRGRRSDWATTEFAAMASDWFDTERLDSAELAALLRSHDLDVLIDLGGWMDPAALRALSAKPARRMYKWVGGQSATTGLISFDGMFSDAWQSPRSSQCFYSEPLILLESGYVTYTVPPYFPVPSQRRPARAGGRLALGVVSNPAKVSGAFLDFLKRQIAARPESRGRVTLRFVDRRYRHAPLRERILSALRGGEHGLDEEAAAIDFAVPANHPEYLSQLAALDAVIDTFPYTGGLTAIEALALGVPCLTRIGSLLSERHAFSHCRYAGLELEEFDLDTALDELLGGARAPLQRGSLLAAGSPRLNHAALARELCRHIDA